MAAFPKRGTVYRFDECWGGKRLRVSLGVRDPQNAKTLTRQISTALAEGPQSETWNTLRLVLPPESYSTLTANRGLPQNPELSAFEKRFEAKLERRVQLGEIASRTRDLYLGASTKFFERMIDLGVSRISDVSPAVAEQYLVDRKTSILAKGGSGRGLTTEVTTLQTIFNFAIEEGLLKSSPLKGKYKPDAEAQGAEPFEPWEMYKLGKYSNDEDRLAYLLFRHTGMRRSDVAAVTWQSINWTDRVLTWRTTKRRTMVTIPLVPELMDALNRAQEEKSPLETDTILGKTKAQLYTMMVTLGKRAGVDKVHPHRFRDSLAVQILMGGGSLYDVARVLGITASVADRNYTKFTPQLQDRVRKIMEKGVQN